jgi:hypothetical protein
VDSKPEPLINQDPNVKSWAAHLIGGKKLGYFDTVSRAAAIAVRSRCLVLDE